MRLVRMCMVAAIGVLWFPGGSVSLVAAERANPLIAKLEAGQPVIGVWTGAIAAPRITKVIATSDVDFIVADVEHEVYDFNTLRQFLLGVQDFSRRYRPQPRPAPAVLVKVGGRATWDPRFEIAETLKVGPAVGVWVPFGESRADVERVVSAVRGAETSALAGLNIAREARQPWPLDPKGELLLVVMIENEEGVRHAQEIVDTPGVSAVHCVHISDDDAARILKMCQAKGIIGAIDATPADVEAKVKAGWRTISVGWDFGLLQSGLADTIQKMRSVVK